MLKKTVLNATHRSLGARMVDFGGWDMPVNYGSQIEEHHQVRNDVGMFDVCHMRVVDAKGDGVRAFERGDDAFQPREFHEGFERFVVGGVGVFHAADVLQIGVLGTDSGIVEASGNRMCEFDLAIGIR